MPIFYALKKKNALYLELWLVSISKMSKFCIKGFIFTKGKNFYGFVFASMENKTLSKGLLQKEQIFPVRVDLLLEEIQK